MASILSPETKAVADHIDKLAIIREEKSNIAEALCKSCNHRDPEDGSVTYLPTVELERASWESHEAAAALNDAYAAVRVTEDLPQGILNHLLRVRLGAKGSHAWVDKIVAIGGPKLGPMWIWTYCHQHLSIAGHPIDKRVRKALMLEDAYDLKKSEKAA